MTLMKTLGRHKSALPLLVLAAGLGLSAVLGAVTHRETQRAAAQRFDAVAAELARKVEGRFDDYVAVLVGLRARFNAEAPVTRAEFRDYVAGLNLREGYPGFQAVNWAPHVPAAVRDAYERQARQDASLPPAVAARFEIRPPGSRPHYYPIDYIEPLEGNERLLGMDLGAMPDRGNALEEARDRNGLASSGRRIRIAGRDSDVGLAMRLPVYRPHVPLETVAQRRAAYLGSVGAGFSVADMMRGLAAPGEGAATLRLRLVDAGPSPGGIGTRAEARFVAPPAADDRRLVLYDSAAPAPAPERAEPRLDRVLAFELGGHSWLVEVGQDADEVIGGFGRMTAWLVALCGAAISALLAGVVHSLTTARGRAQVLAAAMTRHLRRSERQLGEAQRLASVGSWMLDPASGALHCSDEACRLLGFPPGAVTGLPAVLALVPPHERDAVAAAIDAAVQSRERREFEHHVQLADGTRRWLHVTLQWFEEEGRGLVRGAVRDDTERRKAALRLRLEHEIARRLLGDEDERPTLEQALQAVCAQLSWDRAVLWTGADGGPPRCAAAWPAGDAQGGASGVADEAEDPVWRATANGEPLRLDLLAGAQAAGSRAAAAAAEGMAVGLVVPMAATGPAAALELYSRDAGAADPASLASLRVIALQIAQYVQRKQAEQDLRHLARHDDLTGLLNRAALQEELKRAIGRAKRSGRRFALMFIDLDRFKHINDTLGHGIGDAMIRTCAGRLKGLLRAEDVVARVGGDEFVLLLENLSAVSDAALVAQKILHCCTEPFVIEGHELHVGASIGVSMYPDDGADAETLLKHADVAMYRAKDMGRGTYRFYDPRMNARGTERLMMESALRRAVERGELQLHYQPKLDLRTRRIVGVEALMRWRHPVLGDVPPGRFIPIAEDTGLIEPMGRWALAEACRQARLWQAAGHPVQMAVNLSPRQLDSVTLVDTVVEILRSTGLPASMLELEITESAMMKNAEHAVRLLARLREMGVGLAMDDFGTGYSSLSYLRRLPLSTVKIDRSFIADLPHDPDAQALIDGIVKLAHSLRMKVVAEGVETAAQLDHLAARGCDEVQGWWLSRPAPADEARAFIARHARGPIAQPVAA